VVKGMECTVKGMHHFGEPASIDDHQKKLNIPEITCPFKETMRFPKYKYRAIKP